MATRSNERIVEKASSFMRHNLSSRLTIPEIAREIGYSHAHLRRAFRTVTGKGVRHHLIGLRIEYAKQQLRETELAVTEIAYDAGYNSYTRFAGSFLSTAGMSPTAYREQSRLRGESLPGKADSEPGEREWFHDDFAGKVLGDWWTTQGTWSVEKGMVLGRSRVHSRLGFLRSLPENFRAEVEVIFSETGGRGPGDLFVQICDQEHGGNYCDLAVGTHGNKTGELRMGLRTWKWNDEAVIAPGEWQAVSIEYSEGHLRCVLGLKDIFAFRDSFPPPYENRCKIKIGTYGRSMRIRQFRIVDLGLPKLVSPVRQGDSLFNAGMYENARQFYGRRLAAGAKDAVEMELRFKTAMCHLRQSQFSKAHVWMDTVVPIREDPFWSKQAKLGRLEAHRREGHLEQLIDLGRTLFEDAEIRDSVRAIFQQATGAYGSAGFLAKRQKVLETIAACERPGSVPGSFAKLNSSVGLEDMCEHFQAQKGLSLLGHDSEAPHEIALLALHVLTDAYAFAGDFKKAEEIVARTDREAHPIARARSRCSHGHNFRGMEQMQRAIETYQSIERDFPEVKGWSGFGQMESAMVFLALGELDRARALFERTIKLYSGKNSYMNRDRETIYRLPFGLACGDFGEASGLLQEDFLNKGRPIAERARQGVKAGILLELSGDKEGAIDLWRRLARRFPAARCYFYGNLAKELAQGEMKMEQFGRAPCPAPQRAELFYMIGLLWDKRGNREFSWNCFKSAVTEDPTNRWPAWLSKQRLAEK